MLITPIKFDADIANLVSEYQQFVEPKMEEIDTSPPVLVQKRFSLVFNNKPCDFLNQMPHTLATIERVKTVFQYSKVVYRMVMPCTCYRWHIDAAPGKKTFENYHIPLITNEGCWFVYEGKSYKMPADGSLYQVRNSVYHTFMNAGTTPRVHLMFEI